MPGAEKLIELYEQIGTERQRAGMLAQARAEALMEYGDRAVVELDDTSMRLHFICDELIRQFGYSFEPSQQSPLLPGDRILDSGNPLSVAELKKQLKEKRAALLEMRRMVPNEDGTASERVYRLNCRPFDKTDRIDRLILNARVTDCTAEEANKIVLAGRSQIGALIADHVRSTNPYERVYLSDTAELLQGLLDAPHLAILEQDLRTKAISVVHATTDIGPLDHFKGPVAAATSITVDNFDPYFFPEPLPPEFTGYTLSATFPLKNGKQRIYLFPHQNGTRFSDEKTKILPYLVGQVRYGYDDIQIAKTRLDGYNRELRRARVDSLTGMTNRRGLAEESIRTLSQALRTGSPLSLSLIDIDDFKSINDKFGNAAGDETLRKIARLITVSSRKNDVPGRWGGEEFIVLYPETDDTRAWDAAERVRLAVNEKPIQIAEETHRNFTISQGLIQLDMLVRTVTDDDVRRAFDMELIQHVRDDDPQEVKDNAYELNEVDLDSLKLLYTLEVGREIAFRTMKIAKAAGKNTLRLANYSHTERAWYVYDSDGSTHPIYVPMGDLSPIHINCSRAQLRDALGLPRD